MCINAEIYEEDLLFIFLKRAEYFRMSFNAKEEKLIETYIEEMFSCFDESNLMYQIDNILLDLNFIYKKDSIQDYENLEDDYNNNYILKNNDDTLALVI